MNALRIVLAAALLASKRWVVRFVAVAISAAGLSVVGQGDAAVRVTPGTYLGVTNQQYPVRFVTTRSGLAAFRLRFTERCDYGATLPSRDVTLTLTSSRPGHKEPDTGGIYRHPRAKILSGGRLSTVRFYEQLENGFYENVIHFDVRFVTSKRLSGTFRVESRVFSTRNQHNEFTCATTHTPRLVAYRLA